MEKMTNKEEAKMDQVYEDVYGLSKEGLDKMREEKAKMGLSMMEDPKMRTQGKTNANPSLWKDRMSDYDVIVLSALKFHITTITLTMPFVFEKDLPLIAKITGLTLEEVQMINSMEAYVAVDKEHRFRLFPNFSHPNLCKLQYDEAKKHVLELQGMKILTGGDAFEFLLKAYGAENLCFRVLPVLKGNIHYAFISDWNEWMKRCVRENLEQILFVNSAMMIRKSLKDLEKMSFLNLGENKLLRREW